MFQKVNISVTDLITASKNNVSDPSPNTMGIPSAVDGSPGDSNITTPNLNGINSAGPEVAQKQTHAIDNTGPEARRSALPGDVQYERPSDSEFPTEQDPRVTQPTPQKKGFQESLMDKQSTSKATESINTPNPQNTPNTPNIEDPQIAKTPNNRRVERPNISGWSPSNITNNDPGSPDPAVGNTMLEKGKRTPKYTGSRYNPINYKAPKITPFKGPKLG